MIYQKDTNTNDPRTEIGHFKPLSILPLPNFDSSQNVRINKGGELRRLTGHPVISAVLDVVVFLTFIVLDMVKHY